jgi:hypothetical protein
VNVGGGDGVGYAIGYRQAAQAQGFGAGLGAVVDAG